MTILNNLSNTNYPLYVLVSTSNNIKTLCSNYPSPSPHPLKKKFLKNTMIKYLLTFDTGLARISNFK